MGIYGLLETEMAEITMAYIIICVVKIQMPKTYISLEYRRDIFLKVVGFPVKDRQDWKK